MSSSSRMKSQIGDVTRCYHHSTHTTVDSIVLLWIYLRSKKRYNAKHIMSGLLCPKGLYGYFVAACHYGFLDMVKYLYWREKSTADRRNLLDCSALTIACINNHLHIVQYLRILGIDVHSITDYAMRQACRNNQFRVVKYLLRYENTPEMTDTAFDTALSEKNVRIMKYLINHGYKMTKYSNTHIKMLFPGACQSGNLKMVKLLVKFGADIHWNRDEPLYKASHQGHLHVVKYLIKHGANLYAENELAIKRGQSNTAKYLISVRDKRTKKAC